MTDCEYCVYATDAETAVCDARESGRDSFLCTRPADHDGPHVACAPSTIGVLDQHELASWSDDDQEVSEA